MANVINVPADQPTIIAAIAAAATFDSIRVAPGVYLNNDPTNIALVEILGTDASNNLTDVHRLVPEELITIPQLTPNVP
ncbi:MAG: hypothetical protein K0Q73_103 [Paenibacillus sp.]|jgi:hypothetical protein|nr:hypothetical protein [Paenibacillus sp.]